MPTPRSHLQRYALLALIVAVAASPWHVPRGPQAGPEAHEAEHEPSDWFYAQRAFPRETINQDAYVAAIDRVRRDRAFLRSSTFGTPWEAAGPFNVGGRVTALAVAPGSATIYLGSANGGVFKSTDYGVNWTSVFDDEFAFSIGALAFDPANSSTVYCGTGECNAAIDNYDGSGLYRTQDGGQTWQYVGLEETRRIARVAVDPSNSSRVFVAAMGSQFSTSPDRGLYRSEDAGQSWSKVLFVSDSTGCVDVVVNPVHPETVYCATWERVRRATYRRAYGPECGIWRSIDSGTNWTRLTNGLPAPSDNVGRIGLAIAPSRPSMVYAQIISGAAAGYGGLGLYRTADGGATWTRRDNSGFVSNFSNFGWYFGDVVVDPLDSERVFSLGQYLTRSTDGGVSFVVANVPHVDEHALWIDPANTDHMYIGSDGGFFSTFDGGSSVGNWTQAITIDDTQFYAGAIDASDPARLAGGTQDNNTVLFDPVSSQWVNILGGDGFQCLIDPTDPLVIIAEWQNCSSGSGPQRSVNGGGIFSSPSGIHSSDRWNWMTPLVMNPQNHNVVLVGSHRVYRSTNNGKAYSTISGDLTTHTTAQLVYSTITTLDISAPDTSTYYVGTDDGKVWCSIDRGANWTDISAGLPVRWVTRVTADPVDAQVVYVALSGFTRDEPVARLYRSPDRGSTWVPIAGNLPDVPVNDILVDPDQPRWLYVATDLGVYRSLDRGVTWATLGSGLPFTAVFDLSLHAASRTLVAATHGRSQWKLDLNQELPLTLAVDPTPRATPMALTLSAPRPNPSRGETRLVLELDSRARAEVAVFDAAGRRVRTLLSDRVEAGPHPLAWDGRDERGGMTRAGVYFVRARAADRETSRRVLRVE